MRALASFALAVVTTTLHAQVPAPPTGGHSHDGVARMDKAPVPPSTSLALTYAGHTTTLTLEDLRKLPQTTVHVHNAHTNADEDYTGPLVADLLARAGLASSKQTDPLILHSSVVATGTDGYFVVYSAAEVEPGFSRSQVIVALMKAGQPNTAGGSIQLINTDGAKPARWVHGLTSLNIVSMAP